MTWTMPGPGVRLLAAGSVLAVAGAVAVTGTAGCAGQRAGAYIAHRNHGVSVARLRHGAEVARLRRGAGRIGGAQQAVIHPAAVTGAEQARALRYWTAARMAHARPPGPSRSLTVAAPVTTPGLAASPVALLQAAAVRSETRTANWHGGGKVARTTGKVFFTMDSQDYVCSAAVVASANADVVITAAHCVKNGTGSWAANWAFVPGYANSDRPYGTWTASRYFVASQWSHAGNDNDDVAFVTLNPRYAASRTMHVGQVVGGQNIVFGGPPAQAYAFGYPAEPPYDGAVLYYCSGRTTPDPYDAGHDTGLRCNLTAGSSGGPWLSGFDPSTGTGTITSVSSFKYDTDQATLYGPRLGAVAKDLFNRAQR